MTELVNEEKMEMKRQGQFLVLAIERRQCVVVGEYVKVCWNGERFWLWVTAVKDGRSTGVGSNELLLNTDLKEGDVLQFGPEHIYDIIIQEMLDSGGPSVMEEMRRGWAQDA
jgi:hypothetical protein